MHLTDIKISVLFAGVLLSLACPFGSDCLLVYAEANDPYAPYDNGVPEGFMLIEGDIIVPEIWVEGLFDTNWWTNGVVAYEFDGNVTPYNQTRMRDAMDEWEAVANVQFVERDGESNYLHIQNATVNSSAVGMQSGGQVVNIYNWGFRFIMVHELGHALGFWHEHSRPDRNKYVIIHEDRVIDGKLHNFYKYPREEYYGPYDFDSVMHYGQCAFSCCSDPCNPCCTPPCHCALDPENCRTIEVNEPWDVIWQNAIGQRNHLSTTDELTMSFVYPEADWVFVNHSYVNAPQGNPQAGTFLRPYRNFNSASSVVTAGGTIIIQPGNHDEIGVYTTAATLRAPLGGVFLGQGD